jgi:hypothetical protein
MLLPLLVMPLALPLPLVLLLLLLHLLHACPPSCSLAGPLICSLFVCSPFPLFIPCFPFVHSLFIHSPFVCSLFVCSPLLALVLLLLLLPLCIHLPSLSFVCVPSCAGPLW